MVGLCMLSALTHAAEIKVDSAKTDKDTTSANTKKIDGVTTLADLTTAPPKPNLVQPFMPTARQGSWRFGLWRNKGDGYYHTGVDFSGNGSGGDKVLFSDSGTMKIRGGSYNKVVFTRANGDKIVMLHADKTANIKEGSPVVGGTYALMMGQRDKSNNNTYGKHLHYEYHLQNSQSGRQRFIGLGGFIGFTNKTNGKGASFHQNTLGNRNGFSGGGYVVTDPTPYLNRDFIYNATDQDLKLEQYIGNSARTQYNAIYKPNPELPIASGAKRPTKKFANLPPFNDNMTPEQIAAMSGSAIDASMYAGGAGYGIDGQLLNQSMIASFISADNGSDWATLPTPPPSDLTEMTPQEVMSKIAFQRFGNQEWETALVKLSTKGLLTEYTLMNAEENFLRQQNQRMKNRIELQLASLTQANLFEYNKKIEAMSVMARAAAVPKVIDMELQQLPSGYYAAGDSAPTVDLSNLPSDLNGLMDALLDAISHKEGPSHDAYNNGQACGLARSYGQGNGPIKPTTMTPVQLIQRYRVNYTHPQRFSYKLGSNNKDCTTRVFASGFVQTIPSTLAGLIADYPEYANRPYDAQAQRELAKKGLLYNTYRSPLRNFIQKGGNDEDLRAAVKQIAMEWASIGVPSGMKRASKAVVSDNYTTYYGKGNAANKTSTDMVWGVMKKIQEYHSQSKQQS